MAFPGFNRKRKSSISNGDFDKDGVKNRFDCEPLNYKRQGISHEKNPYKKGSQMHKEFEWADKNMRCPKCGARTWDTNWDENYDVYEECENCDWRKKK